MKYVLAAVLALGSLGGCAAAGVTQEEKNAIKAKAQQVAYDRAYKETYELSIKNGMTEEQAKSLALDAARKAAEISGQVVDETVKVKPEGEGGLGKILGSLLYMGLQVGLAFAERKQA